MKPEVKLAIGAAALFVVVVLVAAIALSTGGGSSRATVDKYNSGSSRATVDKYKSTNPSVVQRLDPATWAYCHQSDNIQNLGGSLSACISSEVESATADDETPDEQVDGTGPTNKQVQQWDSELWTYCNQTA